MTTSSTDNSPGILIAYFSYSGNTRELAKYIQEFTDGDLFEILPLHDYPKEYIPCTELARKEKENHILPALKTDVVNLKDYSIVFVGCPSWWHTAPMAVFSFLERNDFSGKTVIPFCTHESTEDGAFAAIERLTPFSNHLKGFDAFGNDVDGSLPAIKTWLREIKIPYRQ